MLTETPDEVVVVLQPPSAPSCEQAFETTPPLFVQSFSAVAMLCEVDTLVQTSTQVWLGPVPSVHAVWGRAAMHDIASYGQQRDEKYSNKRKAFHGASKVGPISSALRRHSCALNSATWGTVLIICQE